MKEIEKYIGSDFDHFLQLKIEMEGTEDSNEKK